MTTEDRAYEAAARALVIPAYLFDLMPEADQRMVLAHAKQIVTTFLTAMGQEVQ